MNLKYITLSKIFLLKQKYYPTISFNTAQENNNVETLTSLYP